MIFLIAVLCFFTPGLSQGKIPISEETQECLECHKNFTPGIVDDWLKSLHAKTTPFEAIKRNFPERRVSAKKVPEKLRFVTVGCYECHALNPKNHRDNFSHFGRKINVVVSPNDCRTCHLQEADQFAASKKAFAKDILDKNPVYSLLVETLIGGKTVHGAALRRHKPVDAVRSETCFGCHGTVVSVKGKKEIKSDAGDLTVPVLANWPNQGVGRVNPDGSRGACTACHPRHGFDIEVARKPHTCAQCHLDPDVPAFPVYMESKHGNLYSSKHADWNFKAVPWRPGRDFSAPTCAACHSARLIDAEGQVLAERTHDFGARLWVRIFGLPYSHPQPLTGKTWEIQNSDKMPMPVTFAGKPASRHLITAAEQEKRRAAFAGICGACHASSWADGQFSRLHAVCQKADEAVMAATQIMDIVWQKNIENNANPFDQPAEQLWLRQWLFYANSVRYAAAMSGPDYAAFKNGFFNLSSTLSEMEKFLSLKQKRKGRKK